MSSQNEKKKNLYFSTSNTNYSPTSEKTNFNIDNDNYSPSESLGADFNDILMENISKKIKRPEFQVIYNGPINDAKTMSNLVAQMKRETKIENRLSISYSLSKTNDELSISRFNQMQGVLLLADWISEYKDKLENEDRVDPKIYEILTNILDFSERLPLSINDLKNSKIGKKVNKLGKCISDKTIKSKCEYLVEKWKRMIEDIKYKKRDRYDSDDKSSPRSEDRFDKKEIVEPRVIPQLQSTYHENYLNRKREESMVMERNIKKYEFIHIKLLHYSLMLLKELYLKIKLFIY
jgi:hypothetical protein